MRREYADFNVSLFDRHKRGLAISSQEDFSSPSLDQS